MENRGLLHVGIFKQIDENSPEGKLLIAAIAEISAHLDKTPEDVFYHLRNSAIKIYPLTVHEKIDFVKQHLPKSYGVAELVESKTNRNISCKSNTGIAEEELWGEFMLTIQQAFPDFAEVYHNVNHNHTDFIIYFSKPK
jgi:hypothetical protein